LLPQRRLMKLQDTATEHLTVIAPTLNEAANVQPLLARVFKQSSTAPQIEVLIVDYGSTDETCEQVLLLGPLSVDAVVAAAG